MTAIRRCALYTRKSSEEGLEQGFNSLDAQREACEAYVKSQAHEGWRAIATRYDDGGYSGGSMERPGLRHLLADIAAGKVDVIVVYKIDRLTRALPNFARMVELFDQHDVSFVSVTQAFNTTGSMGRLTLNVLLSFAQFEREVTGERIRDKIAASKAKGMWMGGTLPLGYDLPNDNTRALVVNDAEADIVRMIFRTYLELGSVHALQRHLAEAGIWSKQRVIRSGRHLGGQPFSRGALFHLLRNQTYRGLIVHKDKLHPGAHPAIIDVELFEAVQQALTDNARRQDTRQDHVVRAPLTGRLFDADGYPMSPSFSHGARGQVYRYYVSAPLQQGQRVARNDSAIRRVPAPALEGMLTDIIRRLLPSCGDEALAKPTRIEVHSAALEVIFPSRFLSTMRSNLEDGEQVERDHDDPALLRLTVPVRMRLRGGRTWILGANHPTTRRDPVLIKALRAAHAMVGSDARGLPVLDTAPTTTYRRLLVRLAFLSPALQQAILEGRQPAGLTLEQIMRSPVPLLWAEQERMFDGPMLRV